MRRNCDVVRELLIQRESPESDQRRRTPPRHKYRSMPTDPRLRGQWSADRDHSGMPTYPRGSCAGTILICG
jgi:hypothetical protein